MDPVVFCFMVEPFMPDFCRYWLIVNIVNQRLCCLHQVWRFNSSDMEPKREQQQQLHSAGFETLHSRGRSGCPQQQRCHLVRLECKKSSHHLCTQAQSECTCLNVKLKYAYNSCFWSAQPWLVDSQLLKIKEGNTNFADSLRFSHTSLCFGQSEGTLLATGSYDGFARIWTKDGEKCFYRVWNSYLNIFSCC